MFVAVAPFQELISSSYLSFQLPLQQVRREPEVGIATLWLRNVEDGYLYLPTIKVAGRVGIGINQHRKPTIGPLTSEWTAVTAAINWTIFFFLGVLVYLAYRPLNTFRLQKHEVTEKSILTTTPFFLWQNTTLKVHILLEIFYGRTAPMYGKMLGLSDFQGPTA